MTNFRIANVKLAPHIFKFLFFAFNWHFNQLFSKHIRNSRTLWRRTRTLVIISKFWKWGTNFTEIAKARFGL